MFASVRCFIADLTRWGVLCKFQNGSKLQPGVGGIACAPKYRLSFAQDAATDNGGSLYDVGLWDGNG